MVSALKQGRKGQECLQEGLGVGQCRLPERVKQVVFCVEGSGEPLKAPEQGSDLFRFECLERLLWPVIGKQIRCGQEGKSNWKPAQGAAWTELAAAAAVVGRGRGIQASRTRGLGEGAQHPANSWLRRPWRRSQPGVRKHREMSRCMADGDGFCWGHVGTPKEGAHKQ